MTTAVLPTFVQGWALPAALLCGLGLAIAAQTGVLHPIRAVSSTVSVPETVVVPAGRFDYRAGGDYIQGGVSISSPLITGHWQPALEIMRYQVSAADYTRCVAAGACLAPHPRHSGRGAVPAVGVSFTDAEAYAAWLSAQTGETWRLPTVTEWDFAADGLAIDHGTLAAEADTSDPSKLWLAQFDAQAAEAAKGRGDLKPAGAFGINRYGVADMGGNVWEWTSTCNSRTRLDAVGAVASRVESCGVRILEGAHRMPMSWFVEDARGGGCSMGVPPDNLGFRLVRDPSWMETVVRTVGGWFGRS